jgi:hypothetical protein
MLKTIKLTDLTLGELVAMNSTESQPAAPKPVDEKHVEPGENVTRLIRRA